ncbi:MAG: hypothetical protein VYE73_18915 [Acidobacteriota bacterium]|nr:hypothetical protein [Acidobacteriota bacterium]
MRRLLIVTVLITGLMAPGALAAEAADESWSLPRTAFGHPDFQGVWANNNATPLERPAAWADRETLSDAELQDLIKAAQEVSGPGEDALFADQLVLAAIEKDKAKSYDPATGNYNGFWVSDRDFSNRTSLVTDPPNGRVPRLTDEKLEQVCAMLEHLSEHPADSWLDRPISERCISYGMPFLLPGYNGYSQIFQTEDHVVIQQEMIHDARIIPLGDRPELADDIRLWHGNSRGWWEGDTLVVETKNFSPKSFFMFATEGMHMTERFTRIGPAHLEWEVTIDDPTTWTTQWTASIPLKGTDEAIFEYACHEGNYGMEGILAGHRAHEAQGKAPQMEQPENLFQAIDCSAVGATATGGGR